MAVNYAAALKTTRMQDVEDAIDAGAGAGKLEIGTSGMAAVLATIPLADPAGAVSGDTLTLTTPQSDTSAAGGGTAAEARIRDSADNDVVTGLAVRASGDPDNGEEIVLDNTSIANGQTVTLTAGTITHG